MRYCLQNAWYQLTVDSRGAESVNLRRVAEPAIPLLWSGDPQIWPYHAPVCFPWCGKLDDGWFEWNGRRFEGAQHGFARELEHQMVEQTKNSLSFCLDWQGDETRWPWSFTLRTVYRLLEERVVVSYTVTNHSAEPMPMQLGFHPGFRCPFLPHTAWEEYRVCFEDGQTVPLSVDLFDRGAIRYGRVGKWGRLEHVESGHYLQVKADHYSTMLIWSKPGIHGLLCMEPWQGDSGPGHDLRLRPGTVVLGTKERFDNTLTISSG